MFDFTADLSVIENRSVQLFSLIDWLEHIDANLKVLTPESVVSC